MVRDTSCAGQLESVAPADGKRFESLSISLARNISIRELTQPIRLHRPHQLQKNRLRSSHRTEKVRRSPRFNVSMEGETFEERELLAEQTKIVDETVKEKRLLKRRERSVYISKRVK